MLEGAAATGRKGIAIGFSPVGGGGQDFLWFAADALTCQRKRRGDHILAGKGGRDEDVMFGGAILMRIAGTADTITASADMGDLQLQWRCIAGQATVAT